MNLVHQMLSTCLAALLRDAMPEVEDVAVPAAVGPLRRAEAVEHGARLGMHGVGRREEDVRVQVALQRDLQPTRARAC